MTSQEIKELEQRIVIVKQMKEKTDDFLDQMLFADEIHNIEMKLNGVKPTDSSIDCIGCGS